MKLERKLSDTPKIIAEVSSNHCGSLSLAETLVSSIAEAGAHSVKFQTFTADSMTLASNAPEFRITNRLSPWFGRSLYDLYSEAQTPWSWFRDLFDIARHCDIEPMSTPFDRKAVDFLETLGISRYKIASFENGDLGLMKYVAETRKPVILSIGMLPKPDLDLAVDTIMKAGCTDLTLLKCTSVYPALPNQLNLLTIEDLKRQYGLPVGFSDHTRGVGAAIAACALGATVVEKHVVTSHDSASLDASFSVDPQELRVIVQGCKDAAQSRGVVSYDLIPDELESAKLRRSLYVIKDLRQGSALTRDCLQSLRPALGMEPKHLDDIIGRRVVRNITAGTPLTEQLLEP